MTQWITDDLEFAAKNAPEVAPDLGRYTRDYARFCLMKHCLNEGEHMEGYYQRAIDMYNELNTGKYDLFKTGVLRTLTCSRMPINSIRNDYGCQL